MKWTRRTWASKRNTRGSSKSSTPKWVIPMSRRKRSKDSKSPLNLNSISKELFLTRKLNSWRKLSRIVAREKRNSALSLRTQRKISSVKIVSRLNSSKSKSRIKWNRSMTWRNKFMTGRLNALTQNCRWKNSRITREPNWSIFKRISREPKTQKAIWTRNLNNWERSTKQSARISRIRKKMISFWLTKN